MPYYHVLLQNINLGVQTHLLSRSECDPRIRISVDNQCGPGSEEFLHLWPEDHLEK